MCCSGDPSACRIQRSVASVVLNALGGSVGREGPIVQLASAGASRLAEALRVPLERRRVLIGCGAAAGMAAAYNAPIGAAMFVMEVVHGNFALEIFGPVVLSSVTATMVSWGAFGSAPLYPVPLVPSPSLLALPLFALLLAAALSPTDAGLGAATVLNPVVPVRIRRTLNVESASTTGWSPRLCCSRSPPPPVRRGSAPAAVWFVVCSTWASARRWARSSAPVEAWSWAGPGAAD